MLAEMSRGRRPGCGGYADRVAWPGLRLGFSAGRDAFFAAWTC
jgi:hypothetical protein